MPKEDKNKPLILSKNLFPVVGIGASAGGLEAFKKLIKTIPDNSGMAYILVQHLHPEHTSALPEILQRETTIPVDQIIDNVEVKPDHVYIIPSNKMLVATDGILQLSPRPPKDAINMPIDIFFSSLAEVHQSHAIGIVLSGLGADGTIGLKNIKDQGGITFAQAPGSAAYDAMPQSAIDADVVDFILVPEKMSQQLLELHRTINKVPLPDIATPGQITEEESFKKILSLLRIRKGVDFTYYKQTTIRRRILRRLAILKFEKIVEYLEYLQQNTDEQDLLFQDLLIPVTEFFRDPKTFESLCDTVFPEILKNKSTTNPLRIWIAGCSTGAEAYSMGICLYEHLSDKFSSIKIQIFATDISEKSIAKARTGLYQKKELEGVSESRLEEFFTKINGSYQLKKSIRDMCVFAVHNFLKDPPFAKIDFISCRNVLIYMEPFLQKKAFTTFHYALNEKGYLLLGKAESTGGVPELFLSVNNKEKLYTRKPLPGKLMMNVASERREEEIRDKDYGLRSNQRKKDDFQKNADDILLSKYTPAGVIVNEQLDIVQFRGSTRDFLEPSPGKASLNILKMAREGLSFELRSALHKSSTTKKVFVKEGILINKGTTAVTIEIIPLLETIDLHFLVLFRDTVSKKELDSKEEETDSGEKETGKKDERDMRIQQLEKELSQSREDMRSISEEQEAANEELQSANEELLSGSEELQSVNEEMETSKEEVQSTNEELITVNQELYDRNEQLNQARLYAESVITTIHEPLLVLDQNLRIKSANKSFYKNFSITEEETIGEVLFELQKSGWNIPELHSHLLKIQTEAVKFLEWEIEYTFPVIGKRTICFNAQPVKKENGEKWILLAFNDITIRKEKEKLVKKNAEDLKKIFENMPQIISTGLCDGTVTYFNQFFLDYSGMGYAEALELGWEAVINPEMMDGAKILWTRALATGEHFNMEVQLKRKVDNMYRWHLWRASPVRNEDNIITIWISAAIDIHDQKTKEESKDEFISIASHELKTPLTTAKSYVQLLEMNLKVANTENFLFAQKAGNSIDRLNNLICELLDISKIKSGKFDLEKTTFDFNEMISAVIEGLQVSSPQHRIIKSGEIPEPVNGDKERLRQVISNLLTNAIKYSPEADTVLVNTVYENGEITVSIKDGGIGIRQENIEKIFERYFREKQHVIHFQGLGIGLHISFEIIQRHGGKLWAESEPGKGSTFYFTIPI